MLLSQQDALVSPSVAPRTVPPVLPDALRLSFCCSGFYLERSILGGGQFTKPRGNTGETKVRREVLPRRVILWKLGIL
jgi:hypothetical protein